MQAVDHFCGPMMVLASPGSGKTTVVVHRIKSLIEKYQVNPHHILVVTFTKAAAVQMKKRFLELSQDVQGVTFGTFHALFFRILREECGYSLEDLMEEAVRWKLIAEIIQSLQLNTNDVDELTEDFFREAGKMVSELIPFDQFEPEHMIKAEFQQIYIQYCRFKDEHHKIDFDDMMLKCYNCLTNTPRVLEKWQKKYKFILVDEFQDVNKIQYECLRLIGQAENNVFVVGDDDQSIYCFRGARPDFLLNFPRDFPGTEKVVLDINYRSTDYIIRLGQRIITNNTNRYEKEINGTGEKGTLTEFFSAQTPEGEADKIVSKIKILMSRGVSLKQIAIIYRTNQQADYITQALAAAGICYNLKDSIMNIYEHWIVKDILSYISLAFDDTDNQAFMRIVNRPKRYVTTQMLKTLEQKGGSSLHNIFQLRDLKDWQVQPLTDLIAHLKQIKKRSPMEAIKYIRTVVGYDRYLEDYGAYRKTNVMTLLEIAEKVTLAAQDVTNFDEYQSHLIELSNQMKEGRKTIQRPLENAVTLSTIHSAKGLEFEAVFLPGIVEGVLPHEKSSLSAEAMEEERRLFYVGVTRAKSYLCLSEYCTKFQKKVNRSIFLREIGLKKRKGASKK